MDKIDIEAIYDKIKSPFQKDFFRAKRYEIPLTILIMEIDQKDFLNHFRASDYLFNLYEDIYLLSALFCNYEEGLSLVKRVKREYEFRYFKKIPVFNVTYHKNYPVPDKSLLISLLKAFEEVKKKSG